MLERPKPNTLENLEYPKELAPVLTFLLKNIDIIENEIEILRRAEGSLTEEEEMVERKYDNKRMAKAEEHLQNFIDGNYVPILNMLESEREELESEIEYYSFNPSNTADDEFEDESIQIKIDTLTDELMDVKRYKTILQNYLTKHR